MESQLLTYAEACEMLRVGRAKIRSLIADGLLDLRDLGHSTKFVTRRSVQKLIDEGRPVRRYSRRRLKLKRAS